MTDPSAPTWTDPALTRRPSTDDGPLDLTRTPLASLDAPAADPDTVREPDGPDPVLGGLEADLAYLGQEIELPEVLIANRLRPGVAVLFSTEIDANKDLTRWRKAAQIKGRPRRGDGENIDQVRYACVGLANLCLEIQRDGRALEGRDGKPLTFASAELWAQYGVTRSSDAVRQFYGSDPYLASTFDAVLQAAGVGEEVEVLDPTGGSSD